MINYSFIIPHHNNPELLQRCIDSIPQREDIEIIVADDNSYLEKKANVIRSDVQIIFIDETKSKGAGRARNIALQKAVGKWLLFADCDDFYLEGFINYLDKYLNSDADVIYFNVFESYNDKNKSYKLEKNNPISKYLKTNKNKYWETIVKHRRNAPWDMMVSHKIVKEHHLEFEEVLKGNDAIFKHTLGCVANIIDVIEEKLYYWCITSGSLTRNKWPKNVILDALYHQKKINEIRIKDGAWVTILPYRTTLLTILRDYDFLFFLKYAIIKFKIMPWLKIWFYKIFYSIKYYD